MDLEISDLTKTYGATEALSGIHLHLRDIRSLAVFGPSGGGKTTLLRVLGGLETPDSGSLTLNGRVVGWDEASLAAHRRRIAFVFQSYNLFPHWTALQNVAEPLILTRGATRDQARTEARQLLERFGLMEHANKRPAQLSGGQQQRVAIARALSLKPEVLLFDEPTSALDPEITADILEIIDQLREEKRDLILVTHEIAFARRACEHAIFLADGKVLAEGPSPELYDRADPPELSRFISRIIHYRKD